MTGNGKATRFSFGSDQRNNLITGTRIIVDQNTGVQYLFAWWGEIGGLTILVDKDGKPLIDESVVTDHK